MNVDGGAPVADGMPAEQPSLLDATETPPAAAPSDSAGNGGPSSAEPSATQSANA
jgi:hypothetical protein